MGHVGGALHQPGAGVERGARAGQGEPVEMHGEHDQGQRADEEHRQVVQAQEQRQQALVQGAPPAPGRVHPDGHSHHRGDHQGRPVQQQGPGETFGNQLRDRCVVADGHPEVELGQVGQVAPVLLNQRPVEAVVLLEFRSQDLVLHVVAGAWLDQGGDGVAGHGPGQREVDGDEDEHGDRIRRDQCRRPPATAGRDGFLDPRTGDSRHLAGQGAPGMLR